MSLPLSRILPHHQKKLAQEFPIVAESIAYKRFLTVWDRTITFPDGRDIGWDVVGHSTPNPAFVTVFPFNTKTKTISALLWEYAQGPNRMAYSLVAGAFDSKKHSSIQQTAIDELSEEANLKQGRWIPLIDEKSAGIPELKWSRNQFMPYVVLDPIVDESPKNRDAEELIDIIPDVSLKELQEIIGGGHMMLPSVQTCFMALNWLRKNGYLTESDPYIM